MEGLAQVDVVAARARVHRAELGVRERARQREQPAEQPRAQEHAGVGQAVGHGAGREEDPRADHRRDDQHGRVVEREHPPQAVPRMAVGDGASDITLRALTRRLYRKGISSSATTFMSLSIGLMAGPAVSLYGSPTVSPVTAALWASEPLPP